MSVTEQIGTRMKAQYEDRSRYYLPRRTYTIIRVDGKSFHTYTKALARPYDIGLMRAMDSTAYSLCEEIQGARLAFIQSDEISILLTDFEKITTSAWFDGNVQKMASVAASLATGFFNLKIMCYAPKNDLGTAFFDARVFCIPDPIEVANYFLWRQLDATRNSISMAAQAHYSHKELHGKSASDMQEMLFRKGINWNNYPARSKRGGAVIRKPQTDDPLAPRWEIVEPPIFTQGWEWLTDRIPVHPDFMRRPEPECV